MNPGPEIEHDQLDALVGLGGRNGVGHVPEQSLGRRTAGGLAEGGGAPVTRQLLDDFALRGDHQRRGVRDAGMEVCRAARMKPKINQQQNQVQDPANTSRIRQTSPKNPMRADPTPIQRLPSALDEKYPDEVQIFSRCAPLCRDKSRK